MKKWLVLLFAVATVQAEGTVPLSGRSIALKTDVRVNTSIDRTRARRPRRYRRWFPHSVTKEKVFLSIEVQNTTPQAMRHLRISYQFYEFKFAGPTGKKSASSRRWDITKTLVPSKKGRLSVGELKPVEKKVVRTEPFEATYRSTQNRRKLVSQTRTRGRRFGGYIVEYYVGDRLIKRDVSSPSVLAARLRSPQGSAGFRQVEEETQQAVRAKKVALKVPGVPLRKRGESC